MVNEFNNCRNSTDKHNAHLCRTVFGYYRSTKVTDDKAEALPFKVYDLKVQTSAARVQYVTDTCCSYVMALLYLSVMVVLT